jgi:hypothetical protein
MPLRLEVGSGGVQQQLTDQSDKVGIPVNDINELLEEITVWSIHEAANDMQREAAWCIIASIINKHTPGGSGLAGSFVYIDSLPSVRRWRILVE